MAYDVARDRIVLFGGFHDLKGDNWEWDGKSWHLIQTRGGSPSARYDHAMVYNAALGQVVLLGGYDNSRFGDSWAWNGHSWHPIQLSAESPSARYDHAIAYNAIRGSVVLFGGVWIRS